MYKLFTTSFNDLFGDLVDMLNDTNHIPTKKDIYIEKALPGVGKDNIKLKSVGNKIDLEFKYDNRVFTYNNFIISDIHDFDKIDASYIDGVLKIKVPLKKEEKVEGKNINIRGD